MKSALRKKTSEFADLVDALVETRRTDKRMPGEFTAREYAVSLNISEQSARWQLRSLAKIGKLSVRTAAIHGKSMNYYCRTNNTL